MTRALYRTLRFLLSDICGSRGAYGNSRAIAAMDGQKPAARERKLRNGFQRTRERGSLPMCICVGREQVQQLHTCPGYRLGGTALSRSVLITRLATTAGRVCLAPENKQLPSAHARDNQHARRVGRTCGHWKSLQGMLRTQSVASLPSESNPKECMRSMRMCRPRRSSCAIESQCRAPRCAPR